MDLHRLGIKFFVTDPASVSAKDFIPIFHTWIQKQLIEDHLLVDVHNYSHIHHGPGILLVAHEGNFSIDFEGGRPGLLYYRKQAGHGSAKDHLASILKSGLQACRLLEDDPSLGGRVRFRTDELLIIANDRLHAPNDERTFSQLQPELSAVLQPLLAGTDFKLTRISENPRERFGVRVQTGQSTGVKTLFSRVCA